jgi:hypothetical protein
MVDGIETSPGALAGLDSTMILHSQADDVVPVADSEELTKISGATLIEVGTDHRLADPESLAAMLKACEQQGS